MKKRASSPPRAVAPRAQLSEWRALAILRRHLDPETRRGVELSIGDDCAILSPTAGAQVWTTDACMENVHFRFDWLSPADVAWKSLHAAVSDVAAMGARPRAALCHVTLRPGISERELQSFARGQAEASRVAGCPIIGGNLTFGREFQVVTTVLGELPVRARGKRALGLKRASARVGDELWLMGAVGLAGLGLAWLREGREERTRAARACLSAFRRPRALVEEGQRLLGRAHACLDVSDGLAGDAAHLARASGVQVIFDADRLLQSAEPELLRVAAALGVEPLESMLQGGEDYALLATGRSSMRPDGARVVGRIESGAGVFLLKNEEKQRLSGGYEHGIS